MVGLFLLSLTQFVIKIKQDKQNMGKRNTGRKTRYHMESDKKNNLAACLR